MKKQAFIYIIIAGILWGTSGIFSHYMTPYGFTPFQITFARSFISLIGMFFYVFLVDRKCFKASFKEMMIFAATGVCLFGTAAFYFTAMRMTSVSTAVVLMYMSPVYVSVFSAIFLGEKFSKLKVVSVVVMLVGCCLVSGLIGGFKFNVIGLLIGFLSGLAYGGYNIFTKIALKNGSHPLTTTFYTFLFVVVVATVTSKPWEIVGKAAVRPAVTLPLLIGVGIVTFILPYFLYSFAMKDTNAGTASALSIVEPMAATVFSVTLLGENLTLLSAAGIVLIIGAVLLLGLAEKNDEK